MAGVVGGGSALDYAESRNYTELLFVFVVMEIAASRPVLRTVMSLVNAVARIVPVRRPLATAWLGLAAVPLLGSLITEPAAMTIAALMLAAQIFRPDVPERVSWWTPSLLRRWPRSRWDGRTYMDAPYAKLSICNDSKVKIAPVHPDFEAAF